MEYGLMYQLSLTNAVKKAKNEAEINCRKFRGMGINKQFWPEYPILHFRDENFSCYIMQKVYRCCCVGRRTLAGTSPYHHEVR